MLAPLLAGLGCSSPPQIVDISPNRGSRDVPTNGPIEVTFDRAMDERSVADHFALSPSVHGQVTWNSPRQMVFNHAPMRTDANYEVFLNPGYRDAAGNLNGLRHHWPFRTESAPLLTASSPGAGEPAADPGAYIALTFTRPMDVGTLAGALSLSPVIGFALRADPADARRIIVAPRALLQPDADYSIAVTRDGLDADGNPLGAGILIAFHTGAQRPLQHWATFIATAAGSAATSGLWIVDENRFPRLLYPGDIQSYSWSPDGARLLIQDLAGSWSDWPVGGVPVGLPIRAGWAAFLAPDLGYAYQDGDRLQQLSPGGQTAVLATGVQEARVAPGGRRIAFIQAAGSGSEIRGVDVALRAQYRIQPEPEPSTDLAWAPDGSALAYRLAAADPARSAVRVRPLTGAGSALTLVSGQLSGLAWQDSRHLIISAIVTGPGGPVSRAFRRSVSDTAPRLDPALGIPAARDLGVGAPQPSPDGRQIVFLSDQAGTSQVWLMNADGTGLSRLTAFDSQSFPYSCSALGWTRT